MTPSLTTYEMQLVTDPYILKAKNEIIQKVYDLFGKLSEEYVKKFEPAISGSKNLINPKISRGENYLGLPYVILDFPRQFDKENILAIRTFFWWGNFFSITLHLAGWYQQQYASAIQSAINNNFFSGWYIGNAKNQWEHHFETNNYSSLFEGRNCKIPELPFLKLAKKIPLARWDETYTFFAESFTMLAEILRN